MENICDDITCGCGLRREPKLKLNCDQVALIMDALKRCGQTYHYPGIARVHELKANAALYEIMEIIGADFEDATAAFNALPRDLKDVEWKQ